MRLRQIGGLPGLEAVDARLRRAVRRAEGLLRILRRQYQAELDRLAGCESSYSLIFSSLIYSLDYS
jgi:hypothetical protein